MADLAPALFHVLKYEGGYVHDSADAGGETYRGISRRYHPGWHAWPLIDGQRRSGGIDDAMLEVHVRHFYKLEYWDRFQGDRIRDQALADELLDQAVNLGVHRAVEHLQRALNALNGGGYRWPDMLRDGKLGPKTLEAIEEAREAGLTRQLVTAIKCQQGVYYLERMEGRPVNERFAAGWLARV